MATTVDNRVVEMKFDNKQFEQGASQTIGTLDKLNNSLKLDNATKGLSGITEAARKVDVSAVSAGLRGINWTLVSVLSVVQTVFRNITTAAMQAGRSLLNQFIKPIKEGFQGYETKVNATAVLMSSTKKGIEEVTAALKDLNDYSDKTIYSFEDMTKNITKFTNAGVGLKDAVEVMKGIGNWAALSGAGMQQAAQVEYQLGQAMGSGVIRAMDWMSVSSAAMDSSRFKEELLAVAVEMGTVKKAANGMYYAVSDTGKKLPFNANAKFRDSLEKQWLTTKVLTGALKNYASQETEIGRAGNKAAADVRTFSQMMSTFADAMKTSWITSFEYIFGNKEEATKFWTAISNAIGSVVGPINQSRNEMLRLWKEMGGRTAVIAGVKNIFQSLSWILKAVGSAFREVFPKKTAADVVKWSKDFLEFTKKLQPSTETLITIRKVFLGVFSAIDLVFKSIKLGVGMVYTFINALLGGADSVNNFGTAIKNAITWVADFFTNLNKGAEKSKAFETALDKIKAKIEEVGSWLNEKLGNFGVAFWNAIKNVAGFVGQLAVGISNAIVSISNGVVQAVAIIDQNFGDIFRSLMLVFTGGGVLAFTRFLENILNVARKGSGSVSQFFNRLTGALGTMQNKLRADALKSIATAILILAGAMLIMSMVPAEKLGPVMSALWGLILGVVGIMASFDKMKGGVAGIGKAAFALNLIGTSLIFMAVAVKILGSVPMEQLQQGMGAIVGLLATFAGFSQIVNKDGGLIKAGFALMLLATGLMVLSGSVQILGNMKLDALKQGMGAIIALLVIFAGFSELVDPKGIIAASTGLVIMAGGMAILAGVVSLFGKMNPDQLGVGLLGLAASLLLIGVAINLVPKDAALRAAGVAILAVAIMGIATALKMLGGMSLDQMAVALIGLAGALLVIIVAVYAMADPMVLIGAAALVIVSGALIMLATALKIIGGMSWGSILKGLGALAGVLVLIGVAGYLLTGAIVGLLGLGAALLMVGAGVMMAGIGVGLLAVGFGILVTSLVTGGRVIVQFLVDLAKAIPTIMYALARGVGAFMQGLVDNSAQMQQTFLQMFTLMVNTLVKVMPVFFQLIRVMLDGILGIITEYGPRISLTFLNLLMFLLTAIQIFLPQIIDRAGNIIVAFINGMSRYYNRIITAGANFIINLIRGIARNALRIVNAAAETILAFINGLTAAVNRYAPQINTAMRGLIRAIFNAGMDALGIYNFIDIGGRLMDGIREGINNAVEGPLRAIRGVINAILGAARRAGLIHSPSKLFAQGVGGPIALGIAAGMVSGTKDVVNAATSVVQQAYSAMADATAQSADVFSNIEEPKITPVVDLSNVYKSASSISSLMGNRAMSITGNVSASMASAARTSTDAAKTAGTPSQQVTFQQNNYSPKALSRLELYRQTKNQLRLLEGP